MGRFRVLYIKIGQLPQLLSDVGKLLLYSGLYIKMDSFLSVPLPLSLPVLLNVFGVIGPVLLQVASMKIKPLFDPRIVLQATLRIVPSPSSVALRLQGLFARNFLTDFLTFTPTPWGWNKKGLAIGTLPGCHVDSFEVVIRKSYKPKESNDQQE